MPHAAAAIRHRHGDARGHAGHGRRHPPGRRQRRQTAIAEPIGAPVRGTRGRSSSSGWLSSSGAIDHGRFEPGTLLGGRYRIVERLGRGGMGEVYRADDLKLGQPVALKFLPPDVDRDPARLTQLHTEVRMARQVSHPNVCRVYDIDESRRHARSCRWSTSTAKISSSLLQAHRALSRRSRARDRAADLRRAGRGARARRHPPRSQARQRHARRHAARSASPTSGSPARQGEAIRAGTPAYMAPEQLAGQRGHGAERHLRARPRSLRALHRSAGARRQEPRGADSQARAVRHPAADRHRQELDPQDRAGDPALPEAGGRRAPGVGARRRRGAARRRSAGSRAGRGRDAVAGRWSRPPAAARRCRSRATLAAAAWIVLSLDRDRRSSISA